MDKIRILDSDDVAIRLKRMAFELYERNYEAESLTVIGIDQRGGYLARQIVGHLEQASNKEIQYIAAHLDREVETIGIDLEIDDVSELAGKPLVVVDDVLYSGKTMLHVVAILLHAAPSSIQTAVLIDRGHRSLPVSADSIGLQLATTVHQHVSVEIDEESGRAEAFLL